MLNMCRWRGQDVLSHSIVAVKVATSLEGSSHLQAEAGVLSRLQHCNIQQALLGGAYGHRQHLAGPSNCRSSRTAPMEASGE
jgi:hypothetical protein